MLQIFGTVNPPLEAYGGVFTGLVPLLNNILRLVFVIAGVFALVNLITAGFQFMSAAGDPKQIEKAWSKIWQSIIGLVIIVGSFLLAAIFGYLIFGDAMAILSPRIWGPGIQSCMDNCYKNFTGVLLNNCLAGCK